MTHAHAKRRVLLVLPDLSGGGAERTTLNLQQHLDPTRFEVEVALLETRGEYLASVPASRWIAPPEGFLRRLARRRPPDSIGRGLPQALLLRWLIRSRRPDVVMSSMADVSLPLAVAWTLMPGLRRRTRWLAREGNNMAAVVAESVWQPFWRRVVGGAIAVAYRRADGVIVTSQGVADDLADRHGISRDRLIVIGNPVDLDAVRALARQPPAIPLPERFVVGVGRLARQKGFDLLLRAIAALDDPGLHLVVLGKGPEEGALKDLARSLGIAERFHLPGFLANPWPVVTRAQAFCLPSRWEGFGHVIVEAMACGTPVVVSDCPHGPGEIVRAGIDGLVVAPDHWQALQRGLAEVLSDKAAAVRRTESAAKRAGDFAVGRVASAYAKAFAAE